MHCSERVSYYFWPSCRISADKLLLTAVHDYYFGTLVLQESTILAVLPRIIFFRGFGS